jgi:3-hydroxybutyrate dehydrogenase/3-oxoacyl-[acyl-carrier protein] reductase
MVEFSHGMLNDPNMSDGPDQYSLAGKRALVVGGTGGIGWELCNLIAQAGADITLHGATPTRVAERTDSLSAAYPSLSVLPLPYKLEPENIPEFLNLVRDTPAPDILILAFGPFVQKTLEKTSIKDWQLVTALDLCLPGALISACLPSMIQKRSGNIILLGGTQTETPRAASTNAAYCAAKTGLSVLVKSIAREYSKMGIVCTEFCPGFVETEYLSPLMKDRLREKTPNNQLISAKNIAEYIFNIGFNPAGLANGATIRLDGGLSL